MEPLEFLDMVWGKKPGHLYVLVWTKQNKNSWWFWDVVEAARYVEKAKPIHDVYVGVGLSPQDFGFHRRCPSRLVKGIAGLWADIDLAGHVHAGKNLPQGEGEVRRALVSVPEPTLVINTGNGLHLWWLFKNIWTFENSEPARILALQWNTYIQYVLAEHNWAFERLADLSRVLRIPGTLNFKNSPPSPVLVKGNSGIRYEREELAEIVRDIYPGGEQEDEVDIVLNGHRGVDVERWLSDFQFRSLWTKEKKLLDCSQSGYDMALANWGVRHGLSPQEVANLIVEYRRVHGGKQRNIEYYKRTIGRAVKSVRNRFPQRIGSFPSVTAGEGKQ